MSKSKVSETEKIYIAMNKPAGVVCSAVSDSHKTVYELLPDDLQKLLFEKRGNRLHTVGRLDCETTGLLLITNDGEWSNYLTRPENKIKKTYMAKLKFPVSKEEQARYIELFKEGPVLPAEKKAPEQKSNGAELTFADDTTAFVTVTEGKFHEVRRLFRAVGNEVLELERKVFDCFDLEKLDLKIGEWKYIDL